MKIRENLTRAALGAVLAGAGFVASAPVQACGADAYTGQICAVAFNYCPENTLPAAGQLIAVSQNQALYALIGNTYGGSAPNSFALPNLQGRTPVGVGTGPGLQPVGWGQARGIDYMTPNIAYMAEHTHAAVFTPTGGGAGAPVTVEAATDNSNTAKPVNGAYLATGRTAGLSATDVNNYFTGTPTGTVTLGGVSGGGGGITGGTVTVGTEGRGLQYLNVPPQLGMYHCIVTEGLWPPRP